MDRVYVCLTIRARGAAVNIFVLTTHTRRAQVSIVSFVAQDALTGGQPMRVALGDGI